MRRSDAKPMEEMAQERPHFVEMLRQASIQYDQSHPQLKYYLGLQSRILELIHYSENKAPAAKLLKGNLRAYRYCDSIWTFNLRDMTFKIKDLSQVASADGVDSGDQPLQYMPALGVVGGFYVILAMTVSVVPCDNILGLYSCIEDSCIFLCIFKQLKMRLVGTPSFCVYSCIYCVYSAYSV